MNRLNQNLIFVNNILFEWTRKSKSILNKTSSHSRSKKKLIYGVAPLVDFCSKLVTSLEFRRLFLNNNKPNLPAEQMRFQ